MMIKIGYNKDKNQVEVEGKFEPRAIDAYQEVIKQAAKEKINLLDRPWIFADRKFQDFHELMMNYSRAASKDAFESDEASEELEDLMFETAVLKGLHDVREEVVAISKMLKALIKKEK